MKKTWKSTQYVGVRYREHPTRKHNNKKDRYFVIRYKRDGKSVSESTGWASERMNAQQSHFLRTELARNIREGKPPRSLAEKREIEEERKRSEEKHQREVQRRQITFEVIAQEFLNWAKTNKKDHKNDKSRYENHIKPSIGNIMVKDISPLMLERLKRDLYNKDLSPKTVHHCLTLIRTIYHKAKIWGLYQGDIPTKSVKFPKLDNKRVRFLSHDEAKNLLAELKGTSMQVYDQSIVALHCGLRFSEIAKLTWADIDLQNGVLQVLDPKGESRQAYITEPVQKVFTRLKNKKVAKSVDLIFPTKAGKLQPHVSNTFYRKVNELGFNEGITDRRYRVCFHSLRHTFASWLALQGTSLYEIMELMGQKDIKMAQRYSHLSPNIKRQAVESLAAGFELVTESDAGDTNKKVQNN